MGPSQEVGMHNLVHTVGYRFHPSNSELLKYYLYNKNNNEFFNDTNPIEECNIYDNEEQWRERFDQTKDKVLFFYSPLKTVRKIACSGMEMMKELNVQRTTSSGTWKTQLDKKIYDKHKRHIGSMRKFSFLPKKDSLEPKGRWVMTEYRLDGELLKQCQNGNKYVICQIKNKQKKKEQEDKEHSQKPENKSSAEQLSANVAACRSSVHGHHSQHTISII